MIEGIKSGEIKRVIMKDMSRFGRDYLQVGMYTEIMYEDNFSVKLSDERYIIFSSDYENEQHTLKAEALDIKNQIAEQDSKVVNINSFVELARKYTSFEKLPPGMLHELVEKIVVHEGDKSSGHCIQKIEIYDSFVGDLESSHMVAQRTRKTPAA